ncbi:hypothetical protein jhhlp_004309 [Lomentospora prolificans]|uniref:HECT-type E3 ubiquitin transferase n=1 Tax=Lomentospora prolificans TaxID=41688 RepID=A0A2N3NB79_9PEZI|nr:hypothetical protein jhhlp_004309 [Lomentospora prolificans]
MLMVGDIAENGAWWSGGQDGYFVRRAASQKQETSLSQVSHRSPHIDWDGLRDWYSTIINAAEGWRSAYSELISEQTHGAPAVLPDAKLKDLEFQLLTAQMHIQRVLLKATDSLLKRPGRPISEPDNLRFLLIVLHNPLLYPNPRAFRGWLQSSAPQALPSTQDSAPKRPQTVGIIPAQYAGIIKRVLGLLSQSSVMCHNHVVSWFARLPRNHFKQVKDLVTGFLTYRLLRQTNARPEKAVDITNGLVPSLDSRQQTAAVLHAALGDNSAPPRKTADRWVMSSDDWQVRAAARVLAFLFAANNLPVSKRESLLSAPNIANNGPQNPREGIQAHNQMLPTSDFYNPLIDSTDLIMDFETWEAKRGFAFCQYPFLLSIAAKIRIMEHETKRQMLTKARDAFFDSILSRKNVNQYWVLGVRRDCLVEDSLTGVSEIIGSGSEDIKKSLRIAFAGEEGIDHGGLRKEWFLLLIREVFNLDNGRVSFFRGPHAMTRISTDCDPGMFVYDEDSGYCYFNANSFETSDQFFLVGVVMGLAIYNSTILDIPLPPFTFRKLLATGPAPAPGSAAHPRPLLSYSLDDLAELRPRLAKGLRQLLDYDGNVEETFGLDFTINTEKYGLTTQVPLLPGGVEIPVTNENRREYVDLYVRYILDVSVTRQFEPFKRGFFTVCGGTALSLFRPEEIELLVRGSDGALDVDALRGVAEYENWESKNAAESEPAVRWFWETFSKASPEDQRKLLSFITGSDRIPAMGASSVKIKVGCLGEDCDRFPIARTCFNMIVLYKYASREKLERMVWTAVRESEGFGLR